MNINITFRHVDATTAIKSKVFDKVAKLQRFLRQPMSARVTLSVEKLEHIVEAQVSAGGVHLEAREKSADMYVTIDKVLAKLERQIRAQKGAAIARSRRGGEAADGEVDGSAIADEGEGGTVEAEPEAAPARRAARKPAGAARAPAKKTTKKASAGRSAKAPRKRAAADD